MPGLAQRVYADAGSPDRSGDLRQWKMVREAPGCARLSVILTPVRTPVANSYAERIVRTIRRECLDWILIHTVRHLRRILVDYLEHDHQEWPDRGLAVQPPYPPPRSRTGPIERRDRVGGLIHEYHRAAA